MIKKRLKMTDEYRVKNQPYDVDVIPVEEGQTKRSKFANKVVVGALVVIALSLGLMLSWALDNAPILVVNNSPFPTRTIREHPTAGGVVIMDVDYCKRKDMDGALRISFVRDSRELFLPISEEHIEVGCHKREFPILIPAGATPGRYVVKFRVTYDKNPLKLGEVVEFESQPITVDPATP